MNVRSVITTILFLFVASSVVYLLINEWGPPREARRIAGKAAADKVTLQVKEEAVAREHGQSRTVTVYYFHGNRRCETCRTIEAYTEEAIRKGFMDQLEAGEIEWHVINLDKSENRHFIEDYQLSTRSVVLVEQHNGVQQGWVNLDQVWQLIRDKPRFFKYIQTSLLEFLEGSGG